MQLSDNMTHLNLPYAWAALSDAGKIREKNEDAFWVEPELCLFLVADGMGGHQGGALASKIVAEDLPVMIETRLNKSKSRNPRAIRNIFKKSIIEQNQHLKMEGISETGYKEMGTTLVIALLKNNRAYIANLGDSRLYRFRNSKLVQLTKDHSVISELLEQGRITPEKADNHEALGQLTHYVGMEGKAIPHIHSFALKPNDRLLLCTDGLTDMVDHKTISSILKKQSEPCFACKSLIQAANASGGYDNVTVLVIDWRK